MKYCILDFSLLSEMHTGKTLSSSHLKQKEILANLLEDVTLNYDSDSGKKDRLLDVDKVFCLLEIDGLES